LAVIDQSDGRKYEVEEPFNLETEAQNYAKFRKLTTSDVWENMPGDLATARVVWAIATKTFSDPTGNPTIPAARVSGYEVPKYNEFLKLERKRIGANPTLLQLLATCPIPTLIGLGAILFT